MILGPCPSFQPQWDPESMAGIRNLKSQEVYNPPHYTKVSHNYCFKVNQSSIHLVKKNNTAVTQQKLNWLGLDSVKIWKDRKILARLNFQIGSSYQGFSFPLFTYYPSKTKANTAEGRYLLTYSQVFLLHFHACENLGGFGNISLINVDMFLV